ncbi:MAG: cytoplasmic protein [Oxalobacteraceae bacterium]|nr:MAG: cytoplasmic protein [Oxalobacteraceae bacterium]
MTPEVLQLLVSREMPYGKYKGRLLADLPGHYLGWFAREGFPKGELGSLLALMYELDHNALRDLLTPLRSQASARTVKS